MQTKITIRNEAQTCYIDIEGTIGVAEDAQFESADNRVATFERLRREVQRIAQVKAEHVVVNIRSTGGDVNDALLIYDALRGLDATITTRCYGYTASAATIIAQAADPGQRELSANTLYLIHRATCSIDGNSTSLDSHAELLRKTDERLAELYSLHSGKESEFYTSLMGENEGQGRWLSAEEAIEAGLADRILEEDELLLVEEQSTESNPAEPTEPTEPAEPTKEPLPSNTSTKPHAKRRNKTLAGGIIRYLLSRLAYRIEEWIEQMREKRAEKRAEEQSTPSPEAEPQIAEKPRRTRRTRRKKEQPTEPTLPTTPSEVAEPTEQVEPAEQDKSAEDSMPKASAVAQSASVITFRQRQAAYMPTAVKEREDPAIASHHLLSNEQAYEEDARAFGKR